MFIRKKKVLKLIDNRIEDLEKWEKRWKQADDNWRVTLTRCRGAIDELRLLKISIDKEGD